MLYIYLSSYHNHIYLNDSVKPADLAGTIINKSFVNGMSKYVLTVQSFQTSLHDNPDMHISFRYYIVVAVEY